MLATLFVVRLKRRRRARALLQDIEDLDELGSGDSSDGDQALLGLSAKRGTSNRPPSSSSSSRLSEASSSCDAPVGLGPPPAAPRARGGKVARKGWEACFLLR